MSAAKVYAKLIHDQLQRYARWLPSEEVKVGMVGHLQDEIFYPLAHLSDFGIAFKPKKDQDAKTTYKCMSSSTSEVGLSGSGSGTTGGVNAAGSLNISFSSAKSVYFLLTNCVGSCLDNLIALGSEVLKRVQADEWKLDYVVVTRVISAGSATILQAQSKGASVTIEGNAAGTPVMDILNAGGAVKFSAQGSFGLSTVAEGKLTPLMSLAKVRYTWKNWLLGKDLEFQPDTSSKHTIQTTRLYSLVDSTPMVDVDTKTALKDGVVLNVKLPKRGDFFDLDELVQFAGKAGKGISTGTKTRAGTKIKYVELGFPRSFRVGGGHLKSLVDRIPQIEFDPDRTSEKHVALNVTLAKSGSQVQVQPLINLVKKAAEPKPVVTASAELAFDEIP